MTEALTGRRLRYAVAVVLHDTGRTMSLDEVAARLHAWGYSTSVEPRKAISDALRWERHRGRAIRIRRATTGRSASPARRRAGCEPKSTARLPHAERR